MPEGVIEIEREVPLIKIGQWILTQKYVEVYQALLINETNREHFEWSIKWYTKKMYRGSVLPEGMMEWNI